MTRSFFSIGQKGLFNSTGLHNFLILQELYGNYSFIYFTNHKIAIRQTKGSTDLVAKVKFEVIFQHFGDPQVLPQGIVTLQRV